MPDKLISPIPENTPDLPKQRKAKLDGQWVSYDISHYWPYRDRTGSVLGYVVRYQLPDGNKETPPLTLWETERGLKWIFKGLPEPRPIFNLNFIAHKPNAKIILVEGEKCAELLQKAIDGAGTNNFISSTWMGGSNAVYKTDWEPLRGRAVILWPDNDKPGFSAALNVAGILSTMDCKQKILSIPEGKPDGWDVGDYILNDEADFLTIVNFIKSTMQDLPSSLPRPPEQREPLPDEPPPEQFELDAAIAPFRCLGYNRDEYYYLPSGTMQVRALKIKDHTATVLMSLADLTYWERFYPSKAGPNWKLAVSTLMRICERQGIYDASRVRGRGAWIDKNRWVLHLGDRLICEGKHHSIDAFESRYIYNAALPLKEDSEVEPLPDSESKKLFDIIRHLHWERNIHSNYFAGWAVCAPICGALYWRPHIWLTGMASAGKTWVLEHILQPCLGEYAVFVQSNSTEAGLRQKLGCDALPIMFDEIETESVDAQQRVQNVLELARQASSNTGGKIVKGRASGTAMEFQIQSMFCFSSIGVNLKQQADISRTTVLSLVDPVIALGFTKEEKQAHYAELSAMALIITPEYCSRLRARTVRLLSIIRKNTRIFATAAAEKIGSNRAGDQIGALLAGSYSLVSSNEVSLEAARKWIADRDWGEESQTVENIDSEKCLSTILQHITKVGVEDRTISELLQSVKIDGPRSHVEALGRTGIKFVIENTVQFVYISSSFRNIKKILMNTAWPENWGRILKRLPGAEAVSCTRFLDLRSRAIKLPWSTVFGD